MMKHDWFHMSNCAHMDMHPMQIAAQVHCTLSKMPPVGGILVKPSSLVHWSRLMAIPSLIPISAFIDAYGEWWYGQSEARLRVKGSGSQTLAFGCVLDM